MSGLLYVPFALFLAVEMATEWLYMLLYVEASGRIESRQVYTQCRDEKRSKKDTPRKNSWTTWNECPFTAVLCPCSTKYLEHGVVIRSNLFHCIE